MVKDITKKCKACEINFNKLKGKAKKVKYSFPKDLPVSESMRKSVNILRGQK